MSAKILKLTTDAEFKTNLDAFDYDKYLAKQFSDLRTFEVRAGYGDEKDLECIFTMDSKEWKRLKDKDLLGGIYNRDLSNYLSRAGMLKHYAVPSVNDRARASKGRKQIQVSFRLRGGM